MHNLTVVTGLWRCGSSMMMQILKASGVIPLHQAFHDIHNPNGYYEIDERTSEIVYAEILSGKYKRHCIKSLIPFWRDKNNIIDLGDNIIFMQRDYDEIIASTEKKFGFSPYKRKIQIMERDAKNKLQDQGKRIFFINYNRVIEDPKKELFSIKFMLKDWHSAIQVVNEHLYLCRSEHETIL